MMQALGLIEVVGYPAAIEAADAAVKASNVQLSGLSKVGSGIMTVQLFGDVGAIKAAVEAGERAAKKLGKVRSAHVIPRVDESLIGTIINRKAENTSIVENSLPKLKMSETTSSINLKSPSQSDIQDDKSILVNQDILEDEKETNINNQSNLQSDEEIFSLEDLNKKSNNELRKLIETLGLDIPDKKLKEAKKAELIKFITESRR